MLLTETAQEESTNSSPLARRIDLRGSANTLSEPAINFMQKVFDESGFSKEITFNIEYDSIDYTAEATIGLNVIEEVLPIPSGEYFEILDDVDFVIQAVYNPQEEILDIDAGYIHTGVDDDDAGLIEASLKIPAPEQKARTFLQGASRHLRATLAHEMQHSIQRLVYGRPLDGVTNADLKTHMNDPDEIDARVEEIIAYMDDNVPETQFDNFMVKLESYISMYLDRNASNDTLEEREVYRTRMMDSHLQHYAEKLGIDIPN